MQFQQQRAELCGVILLSMKNVCVIFFVFLRSAAVYKYQILLQVLNQSSNEVYFDAATVQQQPHLKRFACVTDMNRPSV